MCTGCVGRGSPGKRLILGGWGQKALGGYREGGAHGTGGGWRERGRGEEGERSIVGGGGGGRGGAGSRGRE